MNVQYKHKGIEITFDNVSASFTAKIGEKRISAPSLAAAKKQIDNVISATFKPFATLRWWSNEMVPMSVVGIVKSRSKWNARDQFLVRPVDAQGARFGEQHIDSVTLDTPENRALIKAYHEAESEATAQIKVIKDRVEKIRMAIPFVTPENYKAAS